MGERLLIYDRCYINLMGVLKKKERSYIRKKKLLCY